MYRVSLIAWKNLYMRIIKWKNNLCSDILSPKLESHHVICYSCLTACLYILYDRIVLHYNARMLDCFLFLDRYWWGLSQVDGSFHSPEWHAARLASLKTSHTITWEEYKKKQKVISFHKPYIFTLTTKLKLQFSFLCCVYMRGVYDFSL